MTSVVRHISAVAGLSLVLASVLGCQRPGNAANIDDSLQHAALAQESVQLRAEAGLDLGWLSKPKDDLADDPAFAMAPLLIHAANLTAGEASPPSFGAVSRTGDGVLVVDTARPTVYYSRSKTQAAGIEFERVSYVWWYTGSGAPGPQGIRMTLDAEGSPFLWEVLADSGGARLLFVDRALEEAASAELGPPHPGRNHSLARQLSETPDVVIARVIESGVTPLGPFVYLGDPPRDVHTVLCRCMPSEVQDIAGIDTYDLLPLEAVAGRVDEAGFGPSPADLADLLQLPSLMRRGSE